MMHTHLRSFVQSLNPRAAHGQPWAGIGLGSIIGGLTIEHLGLGAVGYVAAVVALLAIAVAWVTKTQQQKAFV
ncbi:hypothetical protein AO067_17125 [Pseudomonas viridiflava ICMP 13104]|uniref:MFS transporter n=1 Tax=Pseudomonas viridiflava ICMP 13104 TaxID=1198305 RepID=A0A0W0H7R1_PSEVI|nr:hypothetical protein AO067_17125 [Pseudomonas viridiflava ICMP 13104]